MARCVRDAARLLDVMVGYDSADPLTAHGVSHAPSTYTRTLRTDALRGARIGVLRQCLGVGSDCDSQDFAEVTAVFDAAVEELRGCGAAVVDPIDIADAARLLDLRCAEDGGAAFMTWMGRSKNPPFDSYAEFLADARYHELMQRRSSARRKRPLTRDAQLDYLLAREQLKTQLFQVMADHRLDAIVHKAVEHTPTLIAEGINPPYVGMKGAMHLNTFIGDLPAVTVPAGFTAAGLPVGISFLGRPFSDELLLGQAYAYEQATRHRRPPDSTPPL